MRFVTFSILMGCCTAALAQTRPADALPSTDELRRTFDERKYKDVVRNVAKILQLKGEAAAQYDRHELLVLKAESHLRLGDAEPAAKAFEDAAGAATDEPAAATDRAMALLARRAKQNFYRPRTTTPASAVAAGEGLSILDPAGRKLALRALYDDERDAAKRRLQVPERASLADLVEVLDAAAPLRTIELGATGATGESDQVIEPLVDRAQKLMKDELKSMSARVEKLDKAANKKRKMGSAYRKRGLSAEEMAELHEIAQACERIRAAAQRFNDAFTSDAAKFSTIRTDAQELHERAEKVLSADYTGIYDRD